MENKLYSIITFNFGNYEIIRDPYYIDENAEYILVTDNKNLKSNVWNILQYNINKSPLFKSYYVRYHPFEFCNTNIAIVLDGSIQIKLSLNNFYQKFIDKNYDICLMVASYFNGTFLDGINYWKLCKNDFDKETLNRFISFCNYYNMLNSHGIIESGFRILKNNKINNELNNEVFNTCVFLRGKDDIFRIDQYVFSIIFIKKYMNKLSSLFVGRDIIHNQFLQYYKHNSNIPYFIPTGNSLDCLLNDSKIKLDKIY